MEHIKKFKTQDEFLTEKPNLPYPCVSYVEETQNVEYKSQSIINAKYNITQDFIDHYTPNNLTEIQIYGGEGLLKSYTINGETHVFEEPKYEFLGEKVNYESIPNGEPFIALDDCIQCGVENLNTAMTWSIDGEIDAQNDFILRVIYVNDKVNGLNPVKISSITTNHGLILSEDNKSFSLTQEACEQYNNSSFVQEEFGVGESDVVYIGFAYERAQDVKDTNSSYECSTKTTFTNGEEQKEITLINNFIYAISKDSCIEGGIGLFNTAMTWTIDSKIDLDNDYICMSIIDGEMYGGALCYPLQDVLEWGFITLHSDNKSFSLTQEACNEYNGYEGTFIGLSIVESSCVSEDGLIISQPTTVTYFGKQNLINSDKISPSAITVPIFQGELDVKYVLCNNATETGYFSMYSNEMPSPLCEIDLSKLDKEKEYKLSDYAFYYARSMSSSFTIPNTITTIGSNSFKYCDGIKELNIPESLKFIGSNAFEECTQFRKINIPSIETWCKIEFENEFSNPFADAYNDFPHLYLNGEAIENFVVPESITSIKPFTFCHMYLSSVVLHNSIKSIGHHSFYKSYLGNLSIPDSVTRIGEYAFYGSHLRGISIPSGVTSIGDYAFAECRSLISITSYAVNAPTIYNNTFYNIHSGGTLTVPGPGGNNSYNPWILSNYSIKYNLGYYSWKVFIAS